MRGLARALDHQLINGLGRSLDQGGVSFEAIAKISFACEAAGDQSHVLFHLRPSAWRKGPIEGSGGSEDPFGDRSQDFYFRENVEEPAAVPTVDGDKLKARALKLSPDRIDPVSASVALESIHPAHENAHQTIGRRKKQSSNQGRLFNFKGLRLDLARIQDRISFKNKDECSQSIDGCPIRTDGGLPCHPLFGDCFLPVMGTVHLHGGKLDRLFGR